MCDSGVVKVKESSRISCPLLLAFVHTSGLCSTSLVSFDCSSNCRPVLAVKEDTGHDGCVFASYFYCVGGGVRKNLLLCFF